MNQKKYTGCLLGSAVGDALGMQTEGMTDSEIRLYHKLVFQFGPGRPGSINEKLRPGQYTDDTEQTMILAKSIVDSGGFYPEKFAGMLSENCQRIISDPEQNRGWGSTSLAACQRLLDGAAWYESGVEVPTCGSAMRAAPIGLLYPGNPAALEEAARLSSIITHSHPESIGGAVAVASAVSLAVINAPPETIILTAAEQAGKYDKFLEKKIKSIEKIRFINEINAFRILGTSIMTKDVVPSAIYCFAHYPLDFARTIITAVNAGGDTDTIAAIAGAISGAYLGEDAIPRKWLEGLELKDKIADLACSLWKIGRHNIDHNI